jgi:hypothetical protein
MSSQTKATLEKSEKASFKLKIELLKCFEFFVLKGLGDTMDNFVV